MKLDRVHPQLRDGYRRYPTFPVYYRPVLWFLKRLMVLKSPPPLANNVELEVYELGNCKVRVFRPRGELSGAGLLWIHGGGYIIGNAQLNDYECSVYARDLQAVVVSVDYRLAPEAPFPAPLDDCFDSWQWFLSKATSWGVDPHRIVIGGQSAGGGLAAGLAQRILDLGGVQPAGQLLFCPMLDDRTAKRAELDSVKHRLWTNRCNRAAWGYYLGVPAGSDDIPPYAAPARRKDLAGLPPAWVGVGSIDLFHDEDCEYARRLQKVGVDCELHVVEDAPHAFESLAADAEISKAYNALAMQFLQRILCVTPN